MKKWADDALLLEAELRKALEGKAELKVDLWPLPNLENSSRL